MAPTSRVADKSDTSAERTDPWPTALRLLTGRDFSQADLRQRLLQKGFDQALVDQAVQRCLELGYLDDARYALSRAASLMRQGRAVGPRVLADLQQHGISKEMAHQALEKAREHCHESELLTTILERRFPNFNYSTAPARERRRVVHFLQRRGFSIGCIMEQLTRKGFETDDDERQ